MFGSETELYRLNSCSDENRIAACLLLHTIVTARSTRVQPKVTKTRSYSRRNILKHYLAGGCVRRSI